MAFTLDWPASVPDIVARACGCSFCVKHGGAWTSDRNARLAIWLRRADGVARYAFGTETAEFLVCGRCGVVPVVTSGIAGHTYAVVNVNTFDNPDSLNLRRQPAQFSGEAMQARLERRQRHWIADVSIATGSPGDAPASP
jgi:hypothetical protein